MFKKSRFLQSVAEVQDFPKVTDSSGKEVKQIAIVGRSNAGKSTLINFLLNHRIAKTSKIPGKTQLVNLFFVDEEFLLVDLPGYGFAKVPISVREAWGPLVQGYLENSQLLNGILFVFDIRRLPDEEDLMMMEWIANSGKAALLVLTKVDKLTKVEVNKQREKILESFQDFSIETALVSSPKKIGREDVFKKLKDMI